jgi:hypothetical protein
MIQPKIQEVLTHEQPNDNYVIVHLEESKLYLQKACTFTPEEFETFKREFGKELLNEVSKNCSCWIYNEANGESETYPIDLEEILPALDDYLLNNKI